jgi:hypothetical protein
MPVNPIRKLDAKNSGVIFEWLTPFRDAGCRILVPRHYDKPLLVDLFSGHMILAPSGVEPVTLEFRFDERYKWDKDASLPSVVVGEGLSVHLPKGPRHENLFIYRTPEERDSGKGLINVSRGMYELPLQDIRRHGFVVG